VCTYILTLYTYATRCIVSIKVIVSLTTADKSGVIINGPINKQFDNTLIASRARTNSCFNSVLRDQVEMRTTDNCILGSLYLQRININRQYYFICNK